MLLKQVTRPAYPPHIPRTSTAIATHVRWKSGGYAVDKRWLCERGKDGN